MEQTQAMPQPQTNESKQDYVSRCIFGVVGDGLSPDEAEIFLKANWDNEIESKFKSKQENKTILKD